MIKDILLARERLEPHILKTEMGYSRSCSEWVGTPVYLKFENQQLTGSFKARGAMNRISRLKESGHSSPIIAASAGNHAQGVAYAANKLGLKAVIVMPTISSLVKIKATKDYGAEVILSGESYDECYQKAVQISQEKGYEFIHPFKDNDVIAGQGTIGFEMIENCEDLDSVIIAVGGGGLISGISEAIKSQKPGCRIYGAVAEEFPGMKNLFYKESQPQDFPAGTLADGIAVKKPDQEMYENYIKKNVEDIGVIGESAIAQAMVFLLERAKTVVEGSGAISLAAAAAAKELGWDLGKKCGILLCGGNIDLNIVSKIISKGLHASGRITRLSLLTFDRPGVLSRVTQLIAEKGANILEVNHDRVGQELRLKETKIEFLLETKSQEHVAEIIAALNQDGIQVLRPQ